MKPAIKSTAKLSRKIIKELAKSEGYKLKGEHKKAADLAEKLLMQDPECAEAAEELADNLLSLEKYEAAKKAALHVLVLKKTSYIAHFVLGFLASHQEDWKLSVEHFRKSNDCQSNNPEILRCLGWALFHNHDHAGGIATLQRGLFLRPDDVAILSDLAACFLQENRFDEALDLLKKAVEISPDDERVQDLLSVVHRVQKAFSRTK